MIRFLLILLTIALYFVSLYGGDFPVLYVAPKLLEIAVHTVDTADVYIDGAVDLKGYSLHLHYNPSLLRIISIHESNEIGLPAFFASFIDSIAGTAVVESAYLGTDASLTGAGKLFRIAVSGYKEGIDTLRLTISDMRSGDRRRIDGVSEHAVVRIGGINEIGAPEFEPDTYLVFQNYPNPFNTATTISFYLPEARSVSVELFDVSGRRIAVIHNEREYQPGMQRFVYDGGGLPSGVYYYRFTATPLGGGRSSYGIGRMTIVK
jgi:hypothetical protein